MADLRMGHIRAMAALSESQPATTKLLGFELSLSRDMAYEYVRDLVGLGFAQRTEIETDNPGRRYHAYQLTDKGSEAARLLASAFNLLGKPE